MHRFFQKTREIKKESWKLFNFEHHLTTVLDAFSRFKKAYLKGENEISLTIQLTYTTKKYSEISYTNDYFFEITAFVENDNFDRQQEFFEFFKDVDYKKFVNDAVKAGISKNCFLPWDRAIAKLHKFLKSYKKTHPDCNFELLNGGATETTKN